MPNTHKAVTGEQTPARIPYGKEWLAEQLAKRAEVTDAGNAPRWGLVECDGKWLVGFDGGGRPIWAFNRLRAGIFNHSEISQEFSRGDKNKLTFIEVNTKV